MTHVYLLKVADSHLESSQKTNFEQKVDSGIDSPTSVSPSPGHDFGFDSFVSSTILQNESFSDSVSAGNQFETENQSTSAIFNGSMDGDDSYWDFKDSFPGTNLKNGVSSNTISYFMVKRDGSAAILRVTMY